jgi:hypothetical protein
LRYTDTTVTFTFEEDKRIGTETIMFSGHHQNYLSACYHAVTKMNYMFNGNFLTPDGDPMWREWFGNYTLSLNDITVEYDTSFRNNVTVNEENVFVITDDSRNSGLRLNVKLNQSAYANMLDGRDLQKPEHIPETIEPKSAAESEANDSVMNGKEEAE